MNTKYMIAALLLLAMPSLLQALPTTGPCMNVTNLALNATANVQIAGQSFPITEKYLTAEYAGVSINGTVINLSNNTAPMQLNGYWAVLTDLSSQGASIEFCAGYLVPTTSVTTTSIPAITDSQPGNTSSFLITLGIIVAAVATGVIGFYVMWRGNK